MKDLFPATVCPDVSCIFQERDWAAAMRLSRMHRYCSLWPWTFYFV